MRILLPFIILLALCAPSYAQIDLQAGLVACYSFTGNANDGSGNNRHGSVQGATLVADRNGVANSAYMFNGYSSHISIPAQFFTLPNYSYSVWAKAPVLPPSGESGCIISIGDQYNTRHQTVNFANSYGTEGIVGINVGGFNTGEPPTTSVPSGILPFTNRWYHIVGVRTNTEMRLYVDGILIRTNSTNGNSPYYGSSVKAYFGARCSLQQFFNGTIDDVVIYNRGLNAAEVTELYKNGIPCTPPPPTAVDLRRGLLACYAFDGSASDGSGNNNHGTLQGPVSATDRYGTANSAYRFDGVNDYISLPVTPLIANKNYTHAVWVNPTINPSSGGSVTMFSIGQSSGKHIGMTLTNNYATASFLGWTVGGSNETGANPATISATSNALPATNRWYHVVCTRDGDYLKLYVNGVLINTMAANNTRPLYYDNAVYTATLGIRAGLSQPFNGLLDDVALYDRALSDAEVQQLYTVGLPCATPTVTVSDQNKCGGGVFTLQATGGAQYNWYDAQTGGTLLYTGDTFTTPSLTQTTSYYVSGTLNGVTSTRKKVTATVLQVPQIICGADVNTQPGVSVNYTASANGGATPYQYTFNFGDLTPAVNTATPNVPHEYPNIGDFTLSISVSDANACRSTCLTGVKVGSPPPDLLRGLIACYSFTGDALDHSGNSLHATPYGAVPTTDRRGAVNSAYEFNGTSDYISLPPDVLASNTYTYSVWAMAASNAANGTSRNVLSVGDFTGIHQTINFSNSYGSTGLVGINAGGFNQGNPTTSMVQSGTQPDLNKWYHIVSVRSSAQVRMYVNGVLVGTAATNGTVPAYGNPVVANIGTRANFSQYFHGAIDDVALYDRPLSEDEIRQLYQTGLPCEDRISPDPIVATQCGIGSFTLTATGGIDYRWYDAQGGGNLVFQGNPFVTPVISSRTVYYVSNVAYGLESSRRAEVVLLPLSQPKLACMFPDSVYANDTHAFAVKATEGTPPYTYAFNFGDGTAFETDRPDTTYRYTESGTFIIRAQVTDNNECMASCEDEIVVKLEDIFIPNVITPDNGDLLNQAFTLFLKEGNAYVRYNGPKAFYMQIINRWGKEVFNTDNPRNVWRGENQASGVYYYSIGFGDRKFKGWVHVIK